MNRREFVKIASSGIAASLIPGWPAINSELKIIDYPSPQRKRRPDRISTNFILLHTTEYGSESSLNSLTRFGNANYMVDRNGDVYRIMERDQISTGAGRSMWNGVRNLDNHAINIEFVGHHNRRLTASQMNNGRRLIEILQNTYGLDDERIMPHSMVAYGRPNKWINRNHRGRKRCGMQFAKEEVRNRLGLNELPSFDPDVRAGRLIAADRYLEGVLYAENSAFVGSHIESIPTIKETNEDALLSINSFEELKRNAGDSYSDASVTYFLPNGLIRRGDELKASRFNFRRISPGTQIAVGYIYGGHISDGRTAYEVAGRNWNLPSTIYRMPDGEIKTGDEINEKSIPERTLILFRR